MYFKSVCGVYNMWCFDFWNDLSLVKFTANKHIHKSCFCLIITVVIKRKTYIHGCVWFKVTSSHNHVTEKISF